MMEQKIVTMIIAMLRMKDMLMNVCLSHGFGKMLMHGHRLYCDCNNFYRGEQNLHIIRIIIESKIFQGLGPCFFY